MDSFAMFVQVEELEEMPSPEEIAELLHEGEED